ncbi:MAG: amidohydrolase family protein [Xanthobacteraceae bacterium]|nr:amidohydrolase family protein [Xanthobacteraceae bacterium]
MSSAIDLVLRGARIAGSEQGVVDIGIGDGRIVAIETNLACEAPSQNLGGRLVVPGFVETHIHLDKSCIIDRCTIRHGTLAEAFTETTAAKRGFTEEDIYARASRTMAKAMVQGTTRLRTHVEIDPRIGFKGFNAIRKLKQDYAWAADIEICVFPQEGLLNDPGCEDLLITACRDGADLIGGCPYVDSDPHGHIGHIFAIAEQFDLDIDFHLDFDLDPSWMHLDEVLRQTEQTGWGGRVAVGHATKLSAIDTPALAAVARRLAEVGVAVTVIPATDLFLMGRNHDHNVPRGVTPAHRLAAHGVTCSLATNNVLNPFTPYGDCSLIRMANLYANVAQVGHTTDIAGLLALVTSAPAKLMNLPDYGILVGNPADVVVLDCTTAVAAVAELGSPMLGFKRGRLTFERPVAAINWPKD